MGDMSLENYSAKYSATPNFKKKESQEVTTTNTNTPKKIEPADFSKLSSQSKKGIFSFVVIAEKMCTQEMKAIGHDLFIEKFKKAFTQSNSEQSILKMKSEGITLEELAEDSFKLLSEVDFDVEKFKSEVNYEEMKKFALGEGFDFGFGAPKAPLTDAEKKERAQLIAELDNDYKSTRENTIRVMDEIDKKDRPVTLAAQRTLPIKDQKRGIALGTVSLSRIALEKTAKRIQAIIASAIKESTDTRMLNEEKKFQRQIEKNIEQSTPPQP